MKKFFAVLAISAFLFSCGDSASTESNTNTEEVTPAPETPETDTPAATDSIPAATPDSANAAAPAGE